MLTVLTSGRLVADPVQKTGANGKPYALCRIGAATDDGSALISAIAFNPSVVEALLRLGKGDDICAVGRGKPSAWIDKQTNEPKGGVSLVIESVLSAYSLRQRRGKAAAVDEEGEP